MQFAQADARIARIDAEISDRTLTAPFDGVITNVDILPGETVTTVPVVTIFADYQFDMVARIPEIDIGKLAVGQGVEMLFDARLNEIVNGEISFISPEAIEIDGVAYYEAIIDFATLPTWIRGGLNADIEIIIDETSDGVRIPKRFLIETADGYEVLRQRGERAASTTVELILNGDDGYVSVRGIEVGDTVVAP